MSRPDPAGLELRSVTAGYGERPVLHEVAMRVDPGEVVGLIGPNGSGKSTLVRAASRGLRPASGTVLVGGRDPYRMGARKAARLVATVPQEFVPAFPFSVLEVVMMGRSPYRTPWGGGSAEDWALARSAMAEANVQHLADRPLDELSGGERQRVVLAQALAQDAPVLLLDEPTTHLDVRHVVEILGLVWSLARTRGTAVLAIFHDLNLASGYCDRLLAIDGGRIVASGAPGEVVTAELMRDVFGLEAEVGVSAATGRPTVAFGGPRPSRIPGSARAHVVGGAGRGAGAMRALAELGYEVTTGVLHAGDTDAVVAEALNLRRVTVPAFSVIDEPAERACRPLVEEAAVVVVADAPYGPGNVANLRLAAMAADLGIPVVMLERDPVEGRDFTGGEATRRWRGLAERAAVGSTEADLVRLVGPPEAAQSTRP